MKFMLKKKRGQIKQIIHIILAMVAVLLIISLLVAPQLYGISDLFKFQQSLLKKDSDNDGIVDGIEVKTGCPCTYGELAFDGCPTTFTEEQKKEDRQEFNSDTGCGLLEVETPEEKKTETKAEKADAEQAEEEFKYYRSIELFADASDEEPRDEILWQACANWVGRECPTRDDDCDEDNFNFQPLTKGCWVMAVEDDGIDDCGQAIADEGTALSLHKFSNLDIDLTNGYQSIDDEPDPKILFSWNWKSKPEYGSLLCKEGFWYGCKGQEGNDLTVGSQTYTCTGSEWVKS